MEEQFIPYELALKLKELGFNEKCLNIWFISTKSMSFKIGYPSFRNSELERTNNITAPLWQQVFDWFREKHNLISGITAYSNSFVIKHNISNQFEASIVNSNETLWMGSYEYYNEAKEATLEELIKRLESKHIQTQIKKHNAELDVSE